MKVYKINLNILRILAFIILTTVGLKALNNFVVSTDTETVSVVKDTKDVSLNDFLSGYHLGSYESIKLNNQTDLEWSVLWTTTWDVLSGNSSNTLTLMSLNKKLKVKNYTVLKTVKPLESSLTDLWISLTGNTAIDVLYEKPSFLWSLFTDHILPILILIGLFALGMKFLWPKWWLWGMPFGMNIGKLAGKGKNEKKVKFSDVIGMEEVKQELTEIVDFLKNPDKYHKVGARPPKWVLLYWPPGVWKTLLAKAVAGEANVAFFSVSGSEFMEMLVGMGASKVRTLFEKARTAGKAIIFIDEIDAIGKRRGGGMSGWHQEQEQTLNQILTEMDGFDTSTNIIVLASTNRPDTLDPALLRSGRFDRKVMVNVPSKEERKLMFEYYLAKKKLDTNLSIDSIVNRSSGMAGADIENVVNEAALKVARDNKKKITNDDLNYAIEKVVMWPERRTKVITEEKRRLVAYHELGHAVTSYYLPSADKLERITIVPRWQSLGATWYSPDEDMNLVSKTQFLEQLISLLWGRAAEELFVGEENITTGASNDFERATKIAADMGTISYMDKWDNDMNNHFRRYSDATTQMADHKIKQLIADAYAKAKAILSDNKEKIEKITTVLLEKEYLSKEEFDEMMK